MLFLAVFCFAKLCLGDQFVILKIRKFFYTQTKQPREDRAHPKFQSSECFSGTEHGLGAHLCRDRSRKYKDEQYLQSHRVQHSNRTVSKEFKATFVFKFCLGLSIDRWHDTASLFHDENMMRNAPLLFETASNICPPTGTDNDLSTKVLKQERHVRTRTTYPCAKTVQILMSEISKPIMLRRDTSICG